MIDEVSIEFDEDIIQWNATYNEIFRTRHGRSLGHFYEINDRIQNLLYDYDVTSEESKIIHDALWLFLFQVQR